jgi:hypothetical protein
MIGIISYNILDNLDYAKQFSYLLPIIEHLNLRSKRNVTCTLSNKRFLQLAEESSEFIKDAIDHFYQ